jgi:hypothetical protein
LNLKDAVQTFERTLIHATLVACDWNQRKASLTLGVLPTTLSEKIRRFDLRPQGARKAAPSRRTPQPGRGLVPAIGIAAGLNSWCPSCGQEAR